MHRVVVCTVVAKSYLSHARVLARSLKQHHPEIPFVTLLADEIDGYFHPAFEPFRLIEVGSFTSAALIRIGRMQSPGITLTSPSRRWAGERPVRSLLGSSRASRLSNNEELAVRVLLL
jgi:hypothetical protein